MKIVIRSLGNIYLFKSIHGSANTYGHVILYVYWRIMCVVSGDCEGREAAHEVVFDNVYCVHLERNWIIKQVGLICFAAQSTTRLYYTIPIYVCQNFMIFKLFFFFLLITNTRIITRISLWWSARPFFESCETPLNNHGLTFCHPKTMV